MENRLCILFIILTIKVRSNLLINADFSLPAMPDPSFLTGVADSWTGYLF